MALPENRPPKSITSSTLVRFSPSTWSRIFRRSDLRRSVPAEALIWKEGEMRPAAKFTRLTTCGPYSASAHPCSPGIQMGGPVVLTAPGNPEARYNLIANAAADSVALIL